MKRILTASKYRERKVTGESSITLERTKENLDKYDLKIDFIGDEINRGMSFYLLRVRPGPAKEEYKNGAEYNEVLELYNAISNEDDVSLITRNLPRFFVRRLENETTKGLEELLIQDLRKILTEFKEIGQKYFDTEYT
ncbi:MAG: hypothetical protein ABIH65_04180 [Nanoarchaeota archaeon]